MQQLEAIDTAIRDDGCRDKRQQMQGHGTKDAEMRGKRHRR